MRSRGLIPDATPLETRLALSSTTLTTFTYRATIAEVRSALGTLARTGDKAEVLAELSRAASRIPFGPSRLLPVWHAKLDAIGPKGSGLQAGRQMLLALNDHLRRGTEAGALRVIGREAKGLAAARLDGFERGTVFINRTNEALDLTLTEPVTGKILLRATIEPSASLYVELKTPDVDSSFPPPPRLVEVSVSFADDRPSRPVGTALASLSDLTVEFYSVAPGEVGVRVLRNGFTAKG